jgi:hypothetical protein
VANLPKSDKNCVTATVKHLGAEASIFLLRQAKDVTRRPRILHDAISAKMTSIFVAQQIVLDLPESAFGV